MRGDGTAGCPSQEWESLRQPPGKPASPLLVVPQPEDNEDLLGQDQSEWCILYFEIARQRLENELRQGLLPLTHNGGVK